MKAEQYRRIRKYFKEYEVTRSDYSRLFGVFRNSQKPTIILARNHNEAIQRYVKRHDRGNYKKGFDRYETTECWATWKVKEVGKANVFTKYF